MNNQHRVSKPTKLKLSEIDDAKLRSEIEMEFTNYNVQRQLSVEAQRTATITQLEAKVREAEAQISLIKVLRKAGEGFEAIQIEPVWFAYAEGNDVVFENPFNERDLRNAVRVQRAQMEQAANSLDENDGFDLTEGE